jgi:hypothetical protein
MEKATSWRRIRYPEFVVEHETRAKAKICDWMMQTLEKNSPTLWIGVGL